MVVFEVSIRSFPSSPSFGSKSKSDQNKINLLVAASKVSCYVILDQLSPCFHVFLSPPNTPTGIAYLHIFIYSLPHSLFYLIQSAFSPLSPNALSANNLKFVCHCGDTEGHCPSYYFPSPPPSSLIYNTSYWVWSKANWIPVKYLYFSLICLI